MAGMQSVTLNTVAPASIIGLDWLAGADKARLAGYIAQLSQKARTVLSLLYVEELNASEVAFVMHSELEEVVKCHNAASAVLRTCLHTV